MSKVLVIGDSCKDEFHYGVCERINPEAPVPIFLPKSKIKNGGMVLNVFENLRALNVETHLITNKDRPTKIRYVDEVSNQMLLRIDLDDGIQKIDELKFDTINFNLFDIIVISDYNKGFLTEKHIEHISQKHPNVFLDTKKRMGDWVKDVAFIKINQKEYGENKDYLHDNYTGNLIITKGREGAMLNHKKSFPIKNKYDVRDLTGAGDTFLAALVASYIKNNDICEAIRFANKCASWVVTQRGVTIISKEFKNFI